MYDVLFGTNTKCHRNCWGEITFSCSVSSTYNQFVHEDVPMHDSCVSFRRLLQLGGHRNASFSLCCWLFLALPISSFSHYYKSSCCLKAFLPLGPVIIFPLFQIMGLTLERGRGREGSCFGAESGTSFPITEIALLRAARGRDNEKENPYLASVPVKIHKRVPPTHPTSPHPLIS